MMLFMFANLTLKNIISFLCNLVNDDFDAKSDL